MTDKWELFFEKERYSITERAGSNPVLLLISGGVDSTVTAAMLLKCLSPNQVHLMYMDTGLMRMDETKNVKTSLEKLGSKHLHIVHCEDEFLGALRGVINPEEKRKTIGDLFMSIQERETARLDLKESYLLAQGTIYPDVLESGTASSGLVKSHHNVGSPMVDAKRKAGLVIEPLQNLYKDEVRELGRFLGVSEETLLRHPFPGPGLAVRVLGEVTKEKCDILRQADAIFIDELKKRMGPSGKSLYDEIWQAFAVLLPLRSTGVTGSTSDSSRENSGAVSRRYGWVLALRAVTGKDAITAGVYPFQTEDLFEISMRITAEVNEIGRVSYDVTAKPPATIEWE